MQGNSGVADVSNKTLVNDAITGGETDFLSAEVGKLGILTYDCSKGGTITHTTLQDAINSVPTTFQKVGLTIIYKSEDTIYRYTLKANSWSTDPANWFSVEDKLNDLVDKTTMDTELYKKFNKESVAQESGDAEDKVMSQKATTAAIADETTRAKAAEEAIIFDVSAHNNGAVFESISALLGGANLSTFIPTSVRRGGMAIRFIQGSVPNPDNKYMQYRLTNQSWSIDVNDWQEIGSAKFSTGEKVGETGIDDKPIAGSKNLVESGGVENELTGIKEILNGKGQWLDPTKAYFTIQLDNTTALDIRSVWYNTNIKNETSGSCTIDFGDGSDPVSIVSADSMKKDNVPAGTYTVLITGITSVLGDTIFRESTLLIDAKLPSTLTSVTGWLFSNVANMDEVTFQGITPPTFSGSGLSPNSLNLVSKIKVPSSALLAYQSSTMSDVMKAKLEAIDEGIVGDITDIKTDVANFQAGLDETNESIQELEDYVEKKLKTLDKTKTYFTIEVSAGNIDLRNIYNCTNIKNETAGTCTVDWGDGTPVVPVVNDDSFKHLYAQAGTYTIIIYGLKSINSDSFLRNFSYIRDAQFANTLTAISSWVLNDTTVDSVTFFGSCPALSGTANSGNSFNNVQRIIVPKSNLMQFINNFYNSSTTTNQDAITKKIEPDEPVDYYYKPATVTVGHSGDFASINDAIQHLSKSYPLYKYGGLKAVIKILSGTTIEEQVYVDGLDLSWITIEYEDYNPSALNYDSVAESIANGTILFDKTEGYNSVAVDASSWTNAGITHDTRGDVCLFRAENGGRLPIINCVFKLTTPNSRYPACGCLCNRGSEAIIKTLCGFIGFQDGVISNNESSITIREGITMNCSRWGCHARHNGEVSARSVIATGCATDTTKANEYGAAVADRVADMDVREAYLGGNYAIRCHNASSICARATHVIGGGVENSYLVQATYSGKINASEMTFTGITEGSKMFEVTNAGWIDTFSVTNKTFNVATLNVISDNNGIIWG